MMRRALASSRWVWFLVAPLGCGLEPIEAEPPLARQAIVDLDPAAALQLPEGFPVPRVPEDNPVTDAKTELGRWLFYDTRLSGNGSQSCASCHEQRLAFSDGKATPRGSTGQALARNSPSLTNTAYNATLTWAHPGLVTLEEQILIPLLGQDPIELGAAGNEDLILERLAADPLYQQMFPQAFPQSDTPIAMGPVVQALSTFVRSLLSGDSPFDRFVYGGDSQALSPSAQNGMDLFYSERLECHHCHGGFNFSQSTVSATTVFDTATFQNTGLYNVDGQGSYPTNNTGLFDFTSNPDDMGKFRAPSLRNIAVTAPYMHDGSVGSLDEVLTIYAEGGRNLTEGPYAGDGRNNPHKSGFLLGFELPAQDRADLLAFLESLTDESFLKAAAHSNPFEGTLP